MKKRYQKFAVSQYLIIVLAFISITSFGIFSAKLMTDVHFIDDFVIPWTAGRSWLLEGENPYAPGVVSNADDLISKSDYLAELPESVVFKQPLINLIFYLPFSLIPYEISRAIWITLLAICIVLICNFSLWISGWHVSSIEKWGVILLFSLWWPGVFSIFTGQLHPLVIVLLIFGIYLILKEQYSTAGFILSLTIGSLPISIFITISILIWSISRRRWSLITAYFSGGVFLFIVSFLLLPEWPLDWLKNLISFIENGDWIKTTMMLLASLLPGIEQFLVVFLHSVILIYMVVLWITTRNATGRNYIWKVSIILLLSVFVIPNLSLSGLYFILPAAFLVFKSWVERWGWIGKLLSWVLIIFIFFGSWLIMLPVLDFSEEVSSPLLFFGLPMLVLLGMIWTRWWALEIPRIPKQYS